MIKKNEKGVALIIAVLTLGILLLLGFYFLRFTLTESRISKSQTVGTHAYYLAEAGINEAIWRLKYDDKDVAEDGDDPWKICFVTTTASCRSDCNATWTTSTISVDLLVPNSTTTVTIVSPKCATGELIATSTVALAEGKTAQRVIKTTVYKSLASPTDDAAIFSGGASENIDIKFSKIKVYGDLFSNHNLNIKWQSAVEVYATGTAKGKILAVGNYDDTGCSVTATAKCAKDICNTTSTCKCEGNPKFQECTATPTPGRCPPKPLATPVVDFDSESSNSFKNRASSTEALGQCNNSCNGDACLCNGSPCSGNNKCVLSDDEFEDLLWAAGESGTLILNTTTTPGITYVEGPIEIRGGRRLVVNGALVADGTIDIGERWKWKGDKGFSQITVNRPTATTTSGLLTKGKINFGPYSSWTTTTIIGVVYANDEIRLVSMPQSFTIKGGLIARKLAFTSILQWLTFIVDNKIMRYGLGWKKDTEEIVPTYSPIITVEHWEESY